MTSCGVAILGAGPYGLSIAAFLAARGIDFRIFGNPMATWQEHMPAGMHLKSEGFASSIYDPRSIFALAAYCQQQGLPYADVDIPVPLETFVSYGLEFQKRFVPGLEQTRVASLRRVSDGFEIGLETGEVFVAREVVVAVGLTYYEYVPPVLSALPKRFVSHSAAHRNVQSFQGQEVAMVGAGASALDLAAFLHEAKARVQIICRKPAVHIHSPPKYRARSILERVVSPRSTIGDGWRSFLCTTLPLVFRLLPAQFRFAKVREVAGPSGGWFIREQVLGKVPFNTGVSIANATVENDRVRLDLVDGAGGRKTLVADHVIAATGYRVDIRRLTFIDPELQSAIRSVEYTPVLSSRFESSVPGLYFVGTSAANTFGPLLRFACGARFTAHRLAKHLARSGARANVAPDAGTGIKASDSSKAYGRS